MFSAIARSRCAPRRPLPKEGKLEFERDQIRTGRALGPLHWALALGVRLGDDRKVGAVVARFSNRTQRTGFVANARQMFAKLHTFGEIRLS